MNEDGEEARSPHAIGAVAIVAAAFLWGTLGVLSVGLFRSGVSPWSVALWRAALSFALLGLYALLFRRDLFRLPPHAALPLLGFGVVGVGLFYVAFQLATFLTSVAVAVVLLYTAPIFVALGARMFLGERLDARKAGALVLVVIGVAGTSLGARGAQVQVTTAGVAWGLVSALSYSAYYLFGKRYVPRYGVARTLLYSLGSGTLVLVVAATLAGHPPRLDLGWKSWGLLLLLSLGATLLANTLYYAGLAQIPASTASILAAVEPVFAALLALVFLDQSLSPLGWAGVAIVVLGITLSSMSRAPHPPVVSGGAPPDERGVDRSSHP